MSVILISLMDEMEEDHQDEVLLTIRRRRVLRDKSNPLEMEEVQFRKNFRFSREVFKILLQDLETKLRCSCKTNSVSNILKLACLLRFCSHGSYQLSVGNDYNLGLSQPTVCVISKEQLNIFDQYMCPKWIRFGTSREEDRCKLSFYEKSGIPGVIGCIDGTHIKIRAPKGQSQHVYYNRKVCNHKMRITYINARFAGSAHDSFIWNLSPLKRKLQDDYRNGETQKWLLETHNVPKSTKTSIFVKLLFGLWILTLLVQPRSTPKRPSEDVLKPSKYDETIKKIKTSAYSPKLGEIQQHQSILNCGLQLSEEEKLNIIKYVENEDIERDNLDEVELKKLILIFEKKNLKNQEMRMKYPDNPEKFMESEIELHSVIQNLKSIATVPDLYPVLTDLQIVSTILELLLHPNTDISVAVVDLLQELTDVDILHESIEGGEILIDTLRKQQICALLVQNLERLNESIKEEANGVYNSLAIFENLTEIKPDTCKEAAQQGLICWILKRLRQKNPFDINKLYSSEILSILLQTESENQSLLGSLNGIDVLLQQLAGYKRHDPSSKEEHEFMENLFNCLCSALMVKDNRERFLKGEGLQLMNLMLREKKMSRNGSLKVLDHAMSGPDGKDNCNKFVDVLGLRTIFPLFMKTPKKNKKRLISVDEHEEHTVSIIASMIRNCRGSQRQRLLAKFTENDYEKVDRLLELHLKYLKRVDTADREIALKVKNQDMNEDEEEENNYVQRLSQGLFTLQLIDYIILDICTALENVKHRVNKILNLRKASLNTVRHIMREYAGNLGELENGDWRDQERAHILTLIDRL